MKTFTIEAYSLEEAKEKAQDLGLTVITNVTQTWKNQKSPKNKDFTVFAKELLTAKRLDSAYGVGLIIATDPGSKDTRERPYKFSNNISTGKRSTKRVIEIRLKETGELIGQAENKNDAQHLAKDLMIKYRQDMVATIVYRVLENKDIAFELKYTPSSSAKLGTYVVFGQLAE